MAVPLETLAVLVHILWTPYSHAPVYSITSFEATYVGCMCSLAVTATCSFGKMTRILYMLSTVACAVCFHMALVFAIMHLCNIFFFKCFIIISVHSFFKLLFNLVLINLMEWSTIPACPSLMCSFNGGNSTKGNSTKGNSTKGNSTEGNSTKGTDSSEMCV